MATQENKFTAKRSLPRQLIPFNRHRFDAAMAVLSHKHKSTLTQLDMVKLHVMIDVFHVLFHGKPVIGGVIEKWAGGAVVAQAYRRLRRAAGEWEQDRTQPDNYKILGKRRNAFIFQPTSKPDERDFSKTELHAMEQSWDCVMSKGFLDRQKFFHDENCFMGRAWIKAIGNKPIHWEDVIDAYADLHPEYEFRDQIKTLVSI